MSEHTYRQITAILNEKGMRSGLGLPFESRLLSRVCLTYGLKSRFQRLRESGMLTLEEIAKQLGVCKETIRRWQRHGLIRAVPFTDSNQCLYELPQDPRESRKVFL